MKFIIIGGGITGVNAAEEIRKLDVSSEVTLIDAESFPLYSRVLLPHYLNGKIAREKVFLKKEAWYHDHQIDWQPGVTVLEIDAKNKFVRTSEERELPFDKLLIATGGEVRLLDSDLKGVSYFRTLSDTDLLFDLLHEVKKRPIEEQQGVVFGGGFISLEYINIFANFKIPTTVVVRGAGFFSRTLSPASQNILISHATKNNVEIRLNDSISELKGDTEIEGVVLQSGAQLPCAILGVGIGLEVDTAWLKDAGVEIDHGVKANEYLETNLPDVYTAGDCAEVMDVIADRQYVVGNWMNALMQGRLVAKSMTGTRSRFELVSSYATNLLGKEIVMIGDVSREQAEEVVQRVATEEESIELFNRHGRTVGAVLIGNVKERQAITNAIKEKVLY